MYCDMITTEEIFTEAGGKNYVMTGVIGTRFVLIDLVAV